MTERLHLILTEAIKNVKGFELTFLASFTKVSGYVIVKYEPELKMVSRFKRMFGRMKIDNDCLEVRDLSSDYIDGDLDEDIENRIKAHVGWCGPCNSFINTLKATVDLLRSTPRQDAPGDFRQRLQDRLNEERR